MRILIVRLGSLGDIVHALPALAALRERHPSAGIDWIADRRHHDFLALVSGLDRAIEWNPSAGLAVALAVLRQLRATRYDAAVDLQGLLKSAVLARLSGARRVIGFDTGHLRERSARLFYTETADPHGAAHVIAKNMALVRALGCDGEVWRFPIGETPSGAPAAVRARLGLGSAGRFAILNPGAAWPNKQWPPARFGALAMLLRERHGLPSIVIWGPGEERLARDVAGASAGAAHVAPATSLADLVAVIRSATVMVSGDTGPLHIAAAVGTPIVGLYGPTSPARNGPFEREDVSISRFNECQCHHRRRCRAARWCLGAITVDEVRAAVDRRMASVECRA